MAAYQLIQAEPAAASTGDLGPRRAESIRANAASGIRWVLLDQGVQQVVRVTVVLVMARLLTPAEFGVMSLALSIVVLLAPAVALGLGNAIVQRRDVEQRHVDTAFTVACVVGTLLTVGLVAASGPISTGLGAPTMHPVLAVLALTLFFRAFESIPNEMLRRSLLFRDCVISNTIGNAVGSVTGVVCAVCGLGVWSLVAFAVVESFVACVLGCWLALRARVWRPGFGADVPAFKELLGFGGYVTGQQFFWQAQSNVDNLAVAHWLGATALGFYGLAFRVLIYPLQRVAALIVTLALPVFSRLHKTAAELHRAFAVSLSYVAVVTFPITIGVAVTANTVVPVVFGPRWSPAGPVLAWLALSGPRIAVKQLCGDLCQATGRPKWDFVSTGLVLAMYIPALAIGLRSGIVGVAVALTVGGYLIAPVDLTLASRALACRVRDIVLPLVPAAVASGVMAVATLLVDRLVLPGGASVARLACLVAVATVTYLLVLRLVAPGLMSRMLTDVKRRAV